MNKTIVTRLVTAAAALAAAFSLTFAAAAPSMASVASNRNWYAPAPQAGRWWVASQHHFDW